MIALTHILAAVDLSNASEHVVAYASSMAQVWKARLTILHVVMDLSYYSGAFVTDTPLSTLQQELEEEADERLESLCAAACDETIPYDALIVTGRPVAEVHRLIRERQVDCLVIGTHSSDKAEHQIFGSTAERLLHQMLCPTIVIPPHRAVDYVSRG